MEQFGLDFPFCLEADIMLVTMKEWANMFLFGLRRKFLIRQRLQVQFF